MLLSEYIADLQNFLNKNGDMPCYYAVDDEGNDYIQVNYSGTLMYVADSSKYRADRIDEECISEYDNVDKVCVIN